MWRLVREHRAEVKEVWFRTKLKNAAPDDLGECPLLECVDIDSTDAALPKALFLQPNLKEVRVGGSIEGLPEGVKLPTEVKVVLDGPKKEDPVVHTTYEAVFEALDMFIESFSGLERVAESLATWKLSKDPDAALLPELILAVSRCYIDDEHGPSSNRFYADQIEEYAPEPLKNASEAVRSVLQITDRTPASFVKGFFNTLESSGLNQAVLAGFVLTMSGNEAARGYLEQK